MLRRRIAVTLVVGIGLFAGSGAGAQTTTISPTTTIPSTTNSTGAVPTTSQTTSTTVGNPCTGQPCTVDPPVATLSGSGGEVRLNPLGFCWRAPEPTAGAGGQISSRCVAAALAPFESIPVGLVVRTGETLTLRFAIGMAPTEVVLRRGDQTSTVALTPGNPTVFTADLGAGVYLLFFTTKWNQGSADYLLKVDARAAGSPATPRTGTLTLTG